jgi:hypothetical protein
MWYWKTQLFFGVHLPLLRVRLASQVLAAVLAAPAHEEADARRAWKLTTKSG